LDFNGFRHEGSLHRVQWILQRYPELGELQVNRAELELAEWFIDSDSCPLYPLFFFSTFVTRVYMYTHTRAHTEIERERERETEREREREREEETERYTERSRFTFNDITQSVFCNPRS